MGSALYRIASEITTVKPFCGAALAIVLLGGRGAIGPVLVSGTIGAVIAKLLLGASYLDTIVMPITATCCVWLMYYFCTSVMKRIDFRGPRDLIAFFIAAAIVCTFSAIVFAAFYFEAKLVPFGPNLVSWAIATTLSFVIFTPLIMLLGTADTATMKARWPSAATVFALYLGSLFLTYAPTMLPTLFLVPCALLVVTMVCEIEGAVLALALTQTVFTVGAVLGYGPDTVAKLPLGYQLYFTQFFMSVLIAIMVPAAAWITERRRLRDEMTETIRKLRSTEAQYRNMAYEAASASRAKSEFLANMSHELRTPLNAIIGFSEVMVAQLFGSLGNQKYSGYALHIHRSGLHLLDLINDVLDLSKIDAGKMDLRESVFPLHEMIDEAVAIVRAQDKHGVLSDQVRLPISIEVRADHRFLKQILINLLSNAVKFTPLGGEVSVEIEAEGTALAIVVSDTGVGMSADQLEKAFAQYGQIDSKIAREHHGTGLGLTLARSLARLHGGDVIASSILGKGTTMKLIVPGVRIMPLQTALQRFALICSARL